MEGTHSSMEGAALAITFISQNHFPPLSKSLFIHPKKFYFSFILNPHVNMHTETYFSVRFSLISESDLPKNYSSVGREYHVNKRSKWFNSPCVVHPIYWKRIADSSNSSIWLRPLVPKHPNKEGGADYIPGTCSIRATPSVSRWIASGQLLVEPMSRPRFAQTGGESPAGRRADRRRWPFLSGGSFPGHSPLLNWKMVLAKTH